MNCGVILNLSIPRNLFLSEVWAKSDGGEVMYAVIKNFMNGDKKVVYKTADLLQARDYAESLNEDFDDPDGAHYTVGMIKENG